MAAAEKDEEDEHDSEEYSGHNTGNEKCPYRRLSKNAVKDKGCAGGYQNPQVTAGGNTSGSQSGLIFIPLHLR